MRRACLGSRAEEDPLHSGVTPARETDTAASQGAEADVRLVQLVKRYGPVTAVGGVSVDIARGELFTLLGPSGSGKTTTLRPVAGPGRAGGAQTRSQGATVAAP